MKMLSCESVTMVLPAEFGVVLPSGEAPDVGDVLGRCAVSAAEGEIVVAVLSDFVCVQNLAD